MKKNRILSLILSVVMMFTIIFPIGLLAETVEVEESEIESIEESVTPEEPAAPVEEEQEEEPAATEEEEQEEEPAAPVEEEQEEEPFTQGYVRVNGGTTVYATESTYEEKGYFTSDAIVYATVTTREGDDAYTWLRIVFDTVEAQEADDDLLNGYVQFKDVIVLSDETVEQLQSELEQSEYVRSFQGNPLSTVNFSSKTEGSVILVEEPIEEAVSTEASGSSASLITITEQPVSSEVVLGQYFVAKVVAEGSNLTYNWQFKLPGTTVWKNSSSVDYKKAELKLKATAVVDGRSYRCVISDDQGNSVTSDEVTLTVITELSDGSFKYQLTENGSGVIVTQCLLEEATVVVPATFQDLPIVEIGEEAFMDNTFIESVDLPNTIVTIRARAFKGCTSLREMRTH